MGIGTPLRSWSEGFFHSGAEVDCVVANDALRTLLGEENSLRGTPFFQVRFGFLQFATSELSYLCSAV